MPQSIGTYATRATRYRKACDVMYAHGLSHYQVIVDLGSGWQGLDFCLRTEYGWQGKYIPVDIDIMGQDLNDYRIKHEADWFVALEILEHLQKPAWLVDSLKPLTRRGIIMSTPNPDLCDVMSMDADHLVEISEDDARGMGFTVERVTFYGGHYSNGEPGDALFGVWTPSKFGAWTP